MKYLKGLLIIPVVIGVMKFNLPNASNNKGIYYDNFKYTDNVIFNGSDGLNIDYTASLSQVGDYYEISFEVINDSSVDVLVSDCSYQDNDSYINYELTYSNGKKIHKGDILKHGEKKQVKYRVLYKNQIEEENYQFDGSFSLNYEQVL